MCIIEKSCLFFVCCLELILASVFSNGVMLCGLVFVWLLSGLVTMVSAVFCICSSSLVLIGSGVAGYASI